MMPTLPPIIYPHPRGLGLHRPPMPGGLHPTLGLPGNWALDFMAPGGTLVFAVHAGVIERWSGHDPRTGVVDGSVFGWSVYLKGPAGATYFYTHLGTRHARVGAHVRPGDLIGTVGHWPEDPGRSHTHLGVTHPLGKMAAQALILRIGRSPMIEAPEV